MKLEERLRKAAADFEAMRRYSANAEDSDCEPHWSDQADMDEASKTAIEAADHIERLERNRDMFKGQVDRQAKTLEDLRHKLNAAEYRIAALRANRATDAEIDAAVAALKEHSNGNG